MRFRAPDEHEAEERAWQVVRRRLRGARAGRLAAHGTFGRWSPAALVAAVVAAVLSPPGRSVVHSLRKAVGVQQAEPALFSLPTPATCSSRAARGAGSCTATARSGCSARYRDAAFSPHGLFVAATRANQLVALDPKGNVRWTLARPAPRRPAWTGTRTDTRIAYLSSGQLRIVAGDGTGDHAIARRRAAVPDTASHPPPGRPERGARPAAGSSSGARASSSRPSAPRTDAGCS